MSSTRTAIARQVKKILTGGRYHLSGDIQNGSSVTHDEVTRKVVRVTDTHVVCECGRKFIINGNLKIDE